MAEIVEFPVSGPNRLRLALQTLDRALGQQRAVALQWAAATRDLQTKMTDLRGNLDRYDAELDRVASGVAGLNAQSRRLEAWAIRQS